MFLRIFKKNEATGWLKNACESWNQQESKEKRDFHSRNKIFVGEQMEQKMFPEGGKKAKENNNANFIFLSKMEGYIHCLGGGYFKIGKNITRTEVCVAKCL